MFAECCVCRVGSVTPLLCCCAGEGCDEGCDGGPSADQQWEDPAELGSSEHATVSSGGFLPLPHCTLAHTHTHTHVCSRNNRQRKWEILWKCGETQQKKKVSKWFLILEFWKKSFGILLRVTWILHFNYFNLEKFNNIKGERLHKILKHSFYL